MFHHLWFSIFYVLPRTPLQHSGANYEIRSTGNSFQSDHPSMLYSILGITSSIRALELPSRSYAYIVPYFLIRPRSSTI